MISLFFRSKNPELTGALPGKQLDLTTNSKNSVLHQRATHIKILLDHSDVRRYAIPSLSFSSVIVTSSCCYLPDLMTSQADRDESSRKAFDHATSNQFLEETKNVRSSSRDTSLSDSDHDESTSMSDSSARIELDLADVIDSCSLLDGELISPPSDDDISEGGSWAYSGSDFSSDSSDEGLTPLTNSFCRILPPSHALPYARDPASRDSTKVSNDNKLPNAEIMRDLYKQLCVNTNKEAKLKNICETNLEATQQTEGKNGDCKVRVTYQDKSDSSMTLSSYDQPIGTQYVTNDRVQNKTRSPSAQCSEEEKKNAKLLFRMTAGTHSHQDVPVDVDDPHKSKVLKSSVTLHKASAANDETRHNEISAINNSPGGNCHASESRLSPDAISEDAVTRVHEPTIWHRDMKEEDNSVCHAVEMTTSSISASSNVDDDITKDLKDNARDTGFESEASSDYCMNSTNSAKAKGGEEKKNKSERRFSEAEVPSHSKDVLPVALKKQNTQDLVAKSPTKKEQHPEGSSANVATNKRALIDAYDDELLSRLLTTPSKPLQRNRNTSTLQRKKASKPSRSNESFRSPDLVRPIINAPIQEKKKQKAEPVEQTKEATPKAKPGSDQVRRGRPSFKKTTSPNPPENLYHMSRANPNQPAPEQSAFAFDPSTGDAIYRPLMHRASLESAHGVMPTTMFNPVLPSYPPMAISPMMQLPMAAPGPRNPAGREDHNFRPLHVSMPPFRPPLHHGPPMLTPRHNPPPFRQFNPDLNPAARWPRLSNEIRGFNPGPQPRFTGNSRHGRLAEVDQSFNRLIDDCNNIESNEDLLDYDDHLDNYDDYDDHDRYYDDGGSYQSEDIRRSGFGERDPHYSRASSRYSPSRPHQRSFEVEEDREAYAEFMENFSRELRDPRLCLREQNFRCKLMGEMQRLMPLVPWSDLERFYDTTMDNYYRISKMYMPAEEKDLEIQNLLESMIDDLLMTREDEVRAF